MVDIEPLSSGTFQAARVETKLMQHGRVDGGHIVAILDGVETDFVGGAIYDTPFDLAAGKAHRETVWMVIAAIRSPGRRGFTVRATLATFAIVAAKIAYCRTLLLRTMRDNPHTRSAVEATAGGPPS